jgi:hypothetical protein
LPWLGRGFLTENLCSPSYPTTGPPGKENGVKDDYGTNPTHEPTENRGRGMKNSDELTTERRNFHVFMGFAILNYAT